MGNNSGKIYRIKRRILWVQQYEKCYYCGKKITFKEATTDHVKPKSQGGTTHIENLVACCRDCNSKKSVQDQPNYLKFPDWWPKNY